METIKSAVSFGFIAIFLCNLLHWRFRGGQLLYQPKSRWIRVLFTIGILALGAEAVLYALRYVSASPFVITSISFRDRVPAILAAPASETAIRGGMSLSTTFPWPYFHCR